MSRTTTVRTENPDGSVTTRTTYQLSDLSRAVHAVRDLRFSLEEAERNMERALSCDLDDRAVAYLPFLLEDEAREIAAIDRGEP